MMSLKPLLLKFNSPLIEIEAVHSFSIDVSQAMGVVDQLLGIFLPLQ